MLGDLCLCVLCLSLTWVAVNMNENCDDRTVEAKVELTSTLFILIGPNEKDANQVEVFIYSFFVLFFLF